MKTSLVTKRAAHAELVAFGWIKNADNLTVLGTKEANEAGPGHVHVTVVVSCIASPKPLKDAEEVAA